MAKIKYLVSIKVEKKIENEWLNWMKNEHIREVINTGYFDEFTFDKILKNSFPPDDNFSYFEIAYFATNWDKYNSYISNFAKSMQEKHLKKFRGNYEASRTTYEFEDVFKISDELKLSKAGM